MTAIIKLPQIKKIVDEMNVIAAMKTGFIQYSNDQTVVPPVGELIFEDPPGDTHIKYGYIKNQDYYVIKIASGFYNNPKIGLPSSQGMMLLFSQKTGEPLAVLLDEGYLTDVRTAAAGALAANYFAPHEISNIGIIGTGIQAIMQLEFLQKVRPCETVWVWGRNKESVERYKGILGRDFDIRIAKSPSELAQHSNLIVTTTPTSQPLLKWTDIQAGTHITAMGSDTSYKQELDADIILNADIVISDSLPQSISRGEVFQARKEDLFEEGMVTELGTAIQDEKLQRSSNNQISVVDLTGVAVQDIMIATAVFDTYLKENH